MRSVFELTILVMVALAWVFVYNNYWDDIKAFFDPGEPHFIVHLTDVALNVTVADDSAERIQGLSGVESMGDFEGKLFIFDESDIHGIWMKDMKFPLDILWFNEDLELVHFERNVRPETFPDVFAPDEPARFVLEMNAYFVDSLQLQEGNRLILPPELLPKDIRERLQE